MATIETMLSTEGYLSELARMQGEFAEILGSADLDLPVRSCGDWTLRDLGVHLGGVYSWSRQIVEGAGPKVDREVPIEGQSLDQWFTQMAGAVHQVLTDTDPEQASWTLDQSRSVGFWIRRQAHESAVHLYDAQDAIGEPQPFSPVLAADNVSEVFDVMLPRMRREPADQLSAPIAFAAADSGQKWLLSADSDRFDVQVGTINGAAVTVTADVADLALGLWERIDRDAKWRIQGDGKLAEEFLSARLTP
ncbi:uncharacterized protein (TIGR03083 family) [Antricoccus suffuscus]|uniref:Uncharacterized protein (TIGR03083 family) n=1 Tax=Antricoccus suffuscus TaxID=1629062 RepID=A0A2T1A4J8_9ACTN|nr:maleylpyruvate isomerase family mycothiol-dependent enzyme [Antricoccus suffuscus]PRZ43427.1 uncharacterized protein (TIGR03083 family) [Antricoccus suffuscus]